MSSQQAGPSPQWLDAAEELKRDEGRVALLAASRLAREASEALLAHARFVDLVRNTSQAALTRIAGGAGAPAQVLRDVVHEIAALRDLASGGEYVCNAEFYRPDIILDSVASAARERVAKIGVAVDYVRSFSNLAIFGAPLGFAVLINRCLDCVAQYCHGGMTLRANFHDAHDGRRMLRLVIGIAAGAVNLPGAELEALGETARKAGASILVNEGALVVMVRAPLATPAALLAAPYVDEDLSLGPEGPVA